MRLKTQPLLLIVSRSEPALAGVLEREFAAEPDVWVIVDRRHGERRRQPSVWAPERRSEDRRSRPDLEVRLRQEGFVATLAGGREA